MNGETEDDVIPLSENLYYTIFGLTMMSAFISWLLFGRLSMARIEKEIQADGHPRPAPWDGIGARILWYAYVYALPIGFLNPREDPFVDVSLIRRYGKTRDRTLAILFMVALYFGIAWVLLGKLVFDVQG